MKTVVPSYYTGFACIKGACRHSCCAGWEIDIDPETCARYDSVPGAFGERLRAGMNRTEEGACFSMREDGRCPFLNDEGLCDIIIELGEDHLSEICDDHPRFRNFFSDRTEMGLGMCCEAAGRLILSQKEPVSDIIIEDDGEDEPLYEEEAEVLDIRAQLMEMMQDRSLPVVRRVDMLLTETDICMPEHSLEKWAEFLLGLERLDDAWAQRLGAMSEETVSAEWDTPFEQLMAYLLWRHLPPAAEDGDIEGRIMLCVIMWRIIRAMFAAGDKTMDELVEIARLCSSELEYSDENIAAILDELNNA